MVKCSTAHSLLTTCSQSTFNVLKNELTQVPVIAYTQDFYHPWHATFYLHIY